MEGNKVKRFEMHIVLEFKRHFYKTLWYTGGTLVCHCKNCVRNIKIPANVNTLKGHFTMEVDG